MQTQNLLLQSLDLQFRHCVPFPVKKVLGKLSGLASPVLVCPHTWRTQFSVFGFFLIAEETCGRVTYAHQAQSGRGRPTSTQRAA